MSSPVKILLVDDHAMVRRGFRLILSQFPNDFEVVGEAGTGEEALELTGKLKPRIVVLDVAMPQMNGVEVTQKLARDWPEVRVLILSMHRDSTYVRETLRAGAKGYLLKDAVDEELIAAVRTIARNEAYISPSVSNTVLSDYQRFVGSPMDLLTPREYEIFKLLAEGKTAKDVAAALEISAYTVDAHRNRIFRKLELRSGADLVRFALRQGIVQ